jgi:hypothetical protein
MSTTRSAAVSTRRRGSKRLLAVLLLLPLVSACDEEARQFAARTAEILQQRSVQLSAKIAKESAVYNAIATHALESSRQLADSRLLNERMERASVLALDYVEGSKKASRWRTDLTEYARLDYTVNRQLLTQDMNAQSRFMTQIQALSLEQDKVDALAMLLATLAKKRPVLEDLQAAGTFLEETKAEFDKKVCDQLAKDKVGTSEAAKRAAALFTAKCQS